MSTGAEWEERAACRGLDPAIFFEATFSQLSGQYRPDGVERAKAICRPCPVREDCLEAALLRREPEGVWGGLTEEERRRLLRRRRTGT